MALAVGSGLCFAASFAPLDAWPLAFLAPAPLVVAIAGASPARAAVLAWIAGSVGAAASTAPWIYAATHRYFDAGLAGGLVFAAGVGQLFHAVPLALFGAAAPALLRVPGVVGPALGLGAAWTAVEYLRSTWLTGAPWNLLAHALHAQAALIQLAEIGGAYAVSFVVATVGAGLGVAALARGGARRRALASAAAVLALALGWGAARLAIVRDDGPSLRVALVQGNVPNAWRERVAHANDAFAAFADATRPVLAERPALVVWSENAVNFVLDPNERFRDEIATLLGADGPLLLLGGPRYEQRTPGRAAFFNSAYLLDGQGRSLGVYDKRRLVPFAEAAPARGVPELGWRFDAPGAYTAGASATIFARPSPFGVLICYEAIYPRLARDLVREGARFLVNISNDAWFGTSAGLEQHFAASVLRAVETRRALARGTNTGITALVGPSGRVLARFPTDRRGGWTVAVPLRDGRTPYAILGDVFAWSAAAGALALLWRVRRMPRS